ncbi:hypothetical protein HPB50_021373 [Hyalomma asiaticum]|uniref:Uncharacterized protein n=1 Tax=Hyalomma asiaticum TaxID=266040 RepID=A0ACB7T491_HYAAI|nr:hypothetical protein HPB50_021373 [Hyalomma asiaticum]
MWDASEVVAPTETQGPVVCPHRGDHVAFSWTLVKCFAVVFLGFALGKARLVKGREVRALDLLASHVCLSALLFLNLSQLRLHTVEWRLVAAVLLGKTALFAIVGAASVALSSFSRHRGGGPLATAGLHAIFVTQVNDFGIAYPLGRDIMLLGDFNGHIQSLDGFQDRNGDLLIETAQVVLLEGLNFRPDCKREFTWCARTRCSCMDYALAAHKLAMKRADLAPEATAINKHNLYFLNLAGSTQKAARAIPTLSS